LCLSLVYLSSCQTPLYTKDEETETWSTLIVVFEWQVTASRLQHAGSESVSLPSTRADGKIS